MLQLFFKTPQVEAHEIAQWLKTLATQTWTLKLDFWNIHKKQQKKNNTKVKTLPYNPKISLLDTYSIEIKIHVHTKNPI